ncbi:MAG TPA: ATP-binding protein [Candidatus Limnocylindrales bacterium]|nr:ATP-binding protein [Candidatus Limnocylindrales bacterium]
MASTPTRRTLRIPSETGHLAEVRSFVREATGAFGATPGVTADLVQAVDEAVCNVILHGRGPKPGRAGSDEIELSAELREGRVEIRILDRAAAFDPTSAAGPDLSMSPRERRPGGMGIHLMRSGTDALHHRPRPDGGNELLLVRRADGATEEG